jgi:type IV pilus assembly protein PilM
MDETKIDWALLGDSPRDKNKVEVLLSSVPNSYVEKMLTIIEHIGLNVIAFEPDSMALSRALLAPGTTSAQVIIDIGNNSTDLIVVMNDAPRLTRAINIGMSTFIKTTSQNLNIDTTQAEQLILKFGMTKDKLEGQAYDALAPAIDPIIAEIEKSIKFFSSRYNGAPIERVIVTGGASAMPGFPVYLSNKTNMLVEIGNAWRNVAYDTSRQTELLTVSNHFAVAVGLAERNND